jgi:hypothetical protein
LSIVKRSELGERRDLFRPLIVADIPDPRKAQSEPRAILRAFLDFIVGDFDDDFRSYGDRVTVVADLKRPQSASHVDKLLVGEAFESLADGSVAADVIGDSKVIIGEPAAPPARAAVGGDDHAIDSFGWFHLEPELAAVAGQVRTA